MSKVLRNFPVILILNYVFEMPKKSLKLVCPLFLVLKFVFKLYPGFVELKQRLSFPELQNQMLLDKFESFEVQASC